MPIVLPPYEQEIGSGDPNFALPGSGYAAPPGVESIIEYAGLILNDRSVVDKYRITEIGGLDDAEIRDVRFPLPGDHGEVALEAFYGGRTITLTGRVEAHNIGKLRDMQQALRTAFAHPWHEHPLIFHTNQLVADVMIYCRKSSPISMREAQRNHMPYRDFQITLRASNPRIVSVVEELNTADVQGNTIDELIFGGLRNIGNFEAQPRIRFGGPLTNPVITNETSGASIALNVAIPLNEYIEVDVSTKRVYDQNGDNRFDVLAPGSDWLGIESGYNDIHLEATSNNTAGPYVFIFHRHTWI